MEFECTINRKSAKEIYKKTGKNVGITIIKIIFCFLAICLFLFLLIKDIAMILLLAGSLIATVIFLIIYYQRQLNMICPKKKDGSSEYLQKVAFLEDEIAVSGDLNKKQNFASRQRKTCRTFQNKNATVKNTVGVAAKYIWTLENKKIFWIYRNSLKRYWLKLSGKKCHRWSYQNNGQDVLKMELKKEAIRIV